MGNIDKWCILPDDIVIGPNLPQLSLVSCISIFAAVLLRTYFYGMLLVWAVKSMPMLPISTLIVTTSVEKNYVPQYQTRTLLLFWSP